MARLAVLILLVWLGPLSVAGQAQPTFPRVEVGAAVGASAAIGEGVYTLALGGPRLSINLTESDIDRGLNVDVLPARHTRGPQSSIPGPAHGVRAIATGRRVDRRDSPALSGAPRRALRLLPRWIQRRRLRDRSDRARSIGVLAHCLPGAGSGPRRSLAAGVLRSAPSGPSSGRRRRRCWVYRAAR